MVQHRPLVDGDHKVINTFLYNLRTLKPGEKAWFETAYFLPRGVLAVLQKELIACAKRGVDVRILTNSAKSTDFKPLVDAAIFDYRALLKAGARIYQRDDKRMVHSKTTVLGPLYSQVGSWNFDDRSASHDSEDGCIIYDSRVNRQLVQTLRRQMKEEYREIKYEEIRTQKLTDEILAATMLLGGEIY